MLHRFVLHNDDIRDASDPVFSIGQVGTLMGWGVFSTLRIARGTLFAFERHWARMKRDAELLRIPFPSEAEYLRERLLQLVAANQLTDGTLRVCIVRNTGTVFVGPGIEREFDLVAMTTGLARWGESVRLGLVPNGRFAASPYSRTKVLSWAFNLNWYQEAHERGYDEVLLLNERNEVAECTSANVFAVFGTNVYTPPLESGCLPGITREILLSEVRLPDICISEKVLNLSDLEKADEIFITSSTRDLLPVTEIETLSWTGSSIVCDRLKRAFTAYLENYLCSTARA